MTEEEAQNFAINTYNDNIQYIEKEHPELFQNLFLFNTALDLEELKPQFDLNFTNSYFDIKNLSTNQLLYGSNSFEISKSLIQNLNTNSLDKSFKAFYPQYPNDEEAKIALEKGLLSEYTFGNAPIVNFVNNNLPQNQELKQIHKFIIFGVGLGIHIPLIHEKLKSSLYLIVEPNLEIFRLSLFVTNYAKLAKEANLILAVAQNEENFRKAFDTFYNDSFIFNHYFKFFQLNDNFSLYTRTIQNRLVSQEFYLYPYNRTFLSIFRTNSYIMEEYKILNLSKNHNLDFTKKPILYLAAGPSLQKNIEFVKKNQEKFIIVAIYATLPFLEQNEIKPDIITQYDEQDLAVLNTLEKVKNINFFDNAIFIFSSHVNAKLINSFKKENIYIFQAMFEQKKDFGILTSPSIGELTYGLLLKLGAKEIYLLGLDLALERESGKSHIDGHSGANAYANLKDESESTDNQYSYKKNIIRVKGNFQDTVKTTPSFKTNIDCFEFFTQENKSKDTKVYNLSDGAYLSDTIPLNIQRITLDNFKEKQKNFKELIKENLEKISEIDYSKEDIEAINFKISNAKKMKKALDTFFKIKNYNKLKDYENNLIYTLQVLIFENNSLDLKSILTNYCQHNIPFIFHLFNTNEEEKNLSFISKINKILYIQLNKVIDTYLVSILYSRNEKNQLNKKLNKLVKEYKIEHTRYCEPFFKELSETAPLRESKTFGKDTLGLFAINENLENKNLIEYILNIVKTFNCKLKLFYFFDYQKNKAQQIFKNIKDQIEYIIPNNLEDIASKIDLWIEIYKHKKLSDILLNNYTNIYSISFDEEIYKKELLSYKNSQQIKELNNSSSFKDTIKQNFILPNTPYYKFCETIKEKIDIERLKSLHTKNQIGFFAFEENLTKEFVKNILAMYDNFSDLKFVIFYFEEKEKKQFETIFTDILDRVIFITPIDIYDLAKNIETWVQAEIKNQSFLFDKIYTILCNHCGYVYPIKLDKATYLWDNKYLNTLVDSQKNSNELSFIKSLNQPINKEKIKDINYPNNIGFFATKENLLDEEFIKYIKELLKKFPSFNLKIYYVDNQIKTTLENIFNKNIQLIKYFNEIKDIEFFIHNHNISNNSFLSICLVQTLQKYGKNIYTLLFTSSLKNKFMKDIKIDNKNFIIKNLDNLNISKNDLEIENYEFYSILYNKIIPNSLNIKLEIDKSKDLFQLRMYEEINFILKYPKLKEFFFYIKKIQLESNK